MLDVTMLARHHLISWNKHMKNQTALAILKAGRSYAEAAEVTGLTIMEVMELWADHQKADILGQT